MRLIDTNVEIGAPAAHVWGVLTDFARFPKWNPFIVSIEGAPKPGAAARRDQAGGQIGDDLLAHRSGRAAREELRWRGRVLLPGIFDGEHAFELAKRGGICSFRQSERGLPAPLLVVTLAAAERGFAAMNAALKKRAEG